MHTSVKLALAGSLFVATTAVAVARPVVVELFTSEGCSSCPPADALLTDLAGRGDVLPLAFHVTYWNSLGWRDPFSFEGATSRQANYAAQLGGGSYTPEIVVDGRRGMVGSERGAVTAAIAASKGPAEAAVHVGRGGEGVTISVGSSGGNGRILLIGFDPQHQTPVGRGENSGRTLVESNIVRSMRTVGTYSGAAVQMTVPRGAGQDLAVLVQASDGAIIGAGRL
jgi:hypothetical protein